MYQRHILKEIKKAIKESPVILLEGARQTGKTTLMRFLLSENGYFYETFDDLRTFSSAKNDPIGFLERAKKPIVIDEIQKVPELFPCIKMIVDQKREPGQFLLTGSANPLLLPKLSESLAGRMEIFTLWPLSQGELNSYRENFLETVFSKNFEVTFSSYSQDNFFSLITNGGFPIIQKITRKEKWIEDYISAILQKDVQEISKIDKIDILSTLLDLLATRTACLFNYSEFSRVSKIPHSSMQRYLSLFRILFLIHFLPSWNRNLTKRITKMPKLLFSDTALICFLLGINNKNIRKNFNFGKIVENFAIFELIKQASWNPKKINFFHFRTHSGKEVDLIIENSEKKLVGIEIKAQSTINFNDTKGLQEFKKEAKENFLRGIILYWGNKRIDFSDDIIAIPMQSIWQT